MRQLLDGRSQLVPRHVRLGHPVRQLPSKLEIAARLSRLFVVFALHGCDIRRLVENHARPFRQVVEERGMREVWLIDRQAFEPLALPQPGDIAVDAFALLAPQVV